MNLRSAKNVYFLKYRFKYFCFVFFFIIIKKKFFFNALEH